MLFAHGIQIIFILMLGYLSACSKVMPKAKLDVGVVTKGEDVPSIEDLVVVDIDPATEDGNIEIEFNDYRIEIPVAAFTSKSRISVKTAAFTAFQSMGMKLTQVVPAEGIEVSLFDAVGKPVRLLQESAIVSRLLPPGLRAEGLMEVVLDDGSSDTQTRAQEHMKVSDADQSQAKYTFYTERLFGKFIIFQINDDENNSIVLKDEIDLQRNYLQSTQSLGLLVQEGLASRVSSLFLVNKSLGNMKLSLAIPAAEEFQLRNGQEYELWLYGNKATDLRPYLQNGENLLGFEVETGGRVYAKEATLHVQDFELFSLSVADPRAVYSEVHKLNFQGWVNMTNPEPMMDKDALTRLTDSFEATLYR